MTVESSKRFVYGTFVWPGKTPVVPPSPPPQRITFGLVTSAVLSAWSEVAIEVLREYSANELLGKLYIKDHLGNWLPADLARIGELQWFTWFHRLSPKARESKAYYFQMNGSGPWSVLHFRTESDETGPYLAIALRYRG